MKKMERLKLKFNWKVLNYGQECGETSFCKINCGKLLLALVVVASDVLAKVAAILIVVTWVLEKSDGMSGVS